MWNVSVTVFFSNCSFLRPLWITVRLTILLLWPEGLQCLTGGKDTQLVDIGRPGMYSHRNPLCSAVNRFAKWSSSLKNMLNASDKSLRDSGYFWINTSSSAKENLSSSSLPCTFKTV